MTTSRSWSRRALLGLPALLALSLGCGDDDKPGDCIADESPDVYGFPDTALRIGRISLDAKTTYGADGKPTTVNSINATLVDITSVFSGSRQRTQLQTAACYGLTGAPKTACRTGFAEPCVKEPLDATKVTVQGLPGGTNDLPKTSKGSYLADNLPSPLFGAGSITARVEGSSAKGFFPTTEVSLRQPEAMEITQPSPTATALGSGDLKISWTPGSADFVQLDLITAAADGTTDKIQCFVHDDGCHTILAGDLEFYDLKEGTRIKISVTRVNQRMKADGDSALDVQASSGAEMVLTR